jgi:hypothetical protein
MPKTAKTKQKQIEPYEHRDKARLNNPPVGLVNPDLDPMQWVWAVSKNPADLPDMLEKMNQ